MLSTDTLPQSFYTQTANAMQRGLPAANAYTRMLRTPVSQHVISQGLFQLLFGHAPSSAELAPFTRGAMSSTGMSIKLVQMSASDSFYSQSGASPSSYRANISQLFLGGAPLPGRLAQAPVSTAAQRQHLLLQLMNTSSFRTAWGNELARIANNQGTFTLGETAQATRPISLALGFERTLSWFLSFPASTSDVALRTDAPSLSKGLAYYDPWPLNPNWVFPQDGTSVTSSSATTTTPLGSPWGNRIGFNGVSYNNIMQATATNPAPVPLLNLPTQTITSANPSQGFSYSVWIQAKGPGAVLAGEYTLGGSGSLSVPYVSVNANGQVVAGLYSANGLSANPGLSLLSYDNLFGDAIPGSPLAITSQAKVIDGTWHHIALVVNGGRQALYVDGLLQGLDLAAYEQRSSGLTTNAMNQLPVALQQTPTPGATISGQILQSNGLTYTFTGKVPSSGASSAMTLTFTNNSGTVPGTYTTISSATLKGDTLTLTMANSVGASQSLTVALTYQTPSSAFSFAPSTSQYALGNLTAVTSGGTIFPTQASNPAPQINYPQPFIGALDEMAFWNTSISQGDVEQMITAPLHLAASVPAPSYYYSFDSAVGQTYPSVAPALNTLAATVSNVVQGNATTIPTDPFPTTPRLPGYQDYGIDLMTPLNTGSVAIAPGSNEYKVGLAAGDQIKVSWPSGAPGSISLVISDDLGQTFTDPNLLFAGESGYFFASRTGTYRFSVTWDRGSSAIHSTEIDYENIPGPLNSLPDLTTSFSDPTAPGTVLYAYSDPNIPQVNTTAGKAGGTGPSNYFPYWNDTAYFPNTTDYTPAQLNKAYLALINAIPNGSGINDFGNITGSDAVAPSLINSALNSAYTAAFNAAPPSPPNAFAFTGYPLPENYFNLGTATSPQTAVYMFFYNTNLMRQAVYSTINGSGDTLESWIQGVINGLNGTAGDVPSNIATIISQGQTEQVQGINVTNPDSSADQQSQKSLFHGILNALGTAIEGAIVAAVGAADPVAGVGVQLGFDSLNSGLAGQSSAAGDSNSNVYVPFTPLTNAILNYQSLTSIASGLKANDIQLWNSIQQGIMSNAYQQGIMSNYGLLAALVNIQGTSLGDAAMAAPTKNPSPLAYSAWESMVPATFQWKQVPATGFPSANGATASYNPQTITVNTSNQPSAKGAWGVASADFNKDGIPDIAVSNQSSSTLSVLLASSTTVPIYNQPVSYTGNETTYSTNGGTGCEGVAVGDFNGDGYPDIAIANNTSSTVTILLNDGASNPGHFAAAQNIGLEGGTGPIQIVVADFNHDGRLDFAVNCEKSSTLVYGINNTAAGSTTVSFTTQEVGLQGGTKPVSIATADFNNDGWPDLITSNAGTSTMSVLINNRSSSGGFNSASTLNTSDVVGLSNVAAGDFNGDGNEDFAVVGFYGNNFGGVPTSLGGNGKAPSGEAVWYFLGNGSGGFATPRWAGMLAYTSVNSGGDSATLTTIPSPNTSSPDGLAVGFDSFSVSNVNGTYSGYVSLLHNVIDAANAFQGTVASTGTAPYLYQVASGAQSIQTLAPSTNKSFINHDLAIGFNGMLVYSDFSTESSQFGVTSNRLINTLATYAPGQSAQTNLLNLGGAVDILDSLGALQGGLSTQLPSYYPNSNPNTPGSPNLQTQITIASPGLFLSWSPATVSGNWTGTSQSQLGGILTAWDLVDSNGNPIALGTVQQLFGTPAYSIPSSTSASVTTPAINNFTPGNSSPAWPGTTVQPAVSNSPIFAYNGGWFFAGKPLNNAPATWAGAFFGWGTSTPGYSPGQLVPANVSNQTIPGGSNTYSINYSPALTGPPTVSSFRSSNSASVVALLVESSPLTVGVASRLRQRAHSGIAAFLNRRIHSSQR